MSSISLLNQPGASSPPNTSPIATPTQELPPSVAISPGPSEIATPLESGRSRELSVDGRPPRSVSPAAREASEIQLAPVLSSPSEPAFPRSNSAENGSGSRARVPSLGSPTLAASQSLGTAPLQVNKNQNAGLGVGPVGLTVPGNKADRRRSINPGMTFNMDAANGTFAVEPRLSPLPPSPLRASFTDLKAGQGPRTPTSPSQTSGTTAFPFPHPAPAPAPAPALHVRQDSGNAPPRTSSLPEQLTKSRSQHFPQPQPHSPIVAQSKDADETTPRLTAPDLPPLTFSISDADFASILNDMDKTSPGEAKGQTASGPSGSISQNSFITKSPQMDQLASVAGEADTLEVNGSRPPPSRSSSASRLAAPQLLQSRQTSAESINSSASRFEAGSALHALAEHVAAAKSASNDKIQIDALLLANIVSETEDLRDQVAGLKSKYSGAKVSLFRYLD
jgi:hypothetical protein